MIAGLSAVGRLSTVPDKQYKERDLDRDRDTIERVRGDVEGAGHDVEMRVAR